MARTHHSEPASPTPPVSPPPRTIPPVPPVPISSPMMGSIVSDRNLIDELRQIYQLAQRHKPVPPAAHLNQALLEALSECADIAEKAVTGYKG